MDKDGNMSQYYEYRDTVMDRNAPFRPEWIRELVYVKSNIPKEKYSFRDEIFEHAQRIGRHYELYKRAFFQTQVRGSNWDEKNGRWRIETDRGDVLNAKFLIMSSGPLNRPKLPAIPGIEQFKGHTFHTSRWDYDYTGGDSIGGLSRLSDKRVGIIGTGATAIQCVNANYAPGVDGMAYEINAFGNCFGTEDFAEGTRAFIEKRKADF